MHVFYLVKKNPDLIKWSFNKIEKALFYITYQKHHFTEEKITHIVESCKKWLVKNFYTNYTPPTSFFLSWKLIAKYTLQGFDWFKLAFSNLKRRVKKPNNKHIKNKKLNYVNKR